MSYMRQRIAVVGGGAVGGYIAAHLAAAQHDVFVIDGWPQPPLGYASVTGNCSTTSSAPSRPAHAHGRSSCMDR